MTFTTLFLVIRAERVFFDENMKNYIDKYAKHKSGLKCRK